MSDKNQAYCACLSVTYTPKEHEPGVMSECWTCNECGSEFVRTVAVEAIRAEEREKADEAERLLRAACAEIVDGVYDKTLDAMREVQSPELADIALAITTAYREPQNDLTHVRAEERERCARVLLAEARSHEKRRSWPQAAALREMVDFIRELGDE